MDAAVNFQVILTFLNQLNDYQLLEKNYVPQIS
jgi:hypothetical protein